MRQEIEDRVRLMVDVHTGNLHALYMASNNGLTGEENEKLRHWAHRCIKREILDVEHFIRLHNDSK